MVNPPHARMDPELFVRWFQVQLIKSSDNVFYTHQLMLRRGGGPIASLEGSIPVFLRKSIATCDYPSEVRTPTPLTLEPCIHLQAQTIFFFRIVRLPTGYYFINNRASCSITTATRAMFAMVIPEWVHILQKITKL